MNKLALTSFWVVTSLLGLVFAVSMGVLIQLHLPPGITVGLAGGIAFLLVFLQYLIGPYIIDWIVQTHWCDPRSVNDEFAGWFRKTCGTFNLTEPRFGIIEDGAPNAFTYGHGAWDARVVITRGVIDMLSPEELRAVVAHELGHIKHRDFILMTVVQGLVLVLYAMYIAARATRNRNSAIVMVASYIAYQLSYYISLFLSRIREYMADFASAQIMQTGNPLSVALVKIAYGLAQSRPAYQVQAPVPSYAQPTYNPSGPLPPNSSVAFSSQGRGGPMPDPMDYAASAVGSRAGFGFGPRQQPRTAPKERFKLEARTFGAFGIAGISAMRTAIAWTGKDGQPDPRNFTKAARWELFNPWAKLAELLSTHPLTVHRIQALQKLNARWGVKNVFDMSKIAPGRYYGFGRDLFIVALPYLAAAAGLGVAAAATRGQNYYAVMSATMFMFGVGMLVKALFSYRGPATLKKVTDLLGEIEVSHINPVPVILQGAFTGRVAPGVPWASDFIVQDDTGFMTCIIRMPFMLHVLFGWLQAAGFIGQPVTVYGWYRRFSAPYIEVDHFTTAFGETRSTYAKALAIMLAMVFMGLGTLPLMMMR